MEQFLPFNVNFRHTFHLFHSKNYNFALIFSILVLPWNMMLTGFLVSLSIYSSVYPGRHSPFPSYTYCIFDNLSLFNLYFEISIDS